jgi:mRNA interferase RelE/StbE
VTGDRYRVVVNDKADKQFQKLDHSAQRRIMLALAKLEENPRPDGVKRLKGSADRWRIRLGDWRILYRIEDGRLIILVIAIGHRSKVCKVD